MIRILHIARYRDSTMRRKVELLAQQPDLRVGHVYPRLWQDELMRVEQNGLAGQPFEATPVAMSRPADPHRGVYHTLTFGMRRFQPHIVHAEEEPDSLAALQIALARRAFAPKARLALNTWQNLDRPLARHVRLILRITLRASDSVLCANQTAVNLLRRRGYAKTAFVLPPIGVDTRVFEPAPHASPGVEFHVGYVGRLVAEKSIETLIDAVAQLGATQPPVRLSLIGSGAHQAALQAYAASLGDRVRFIPPLPPEQVAQRLRRLDALALPSRTTPVWQEQFGRVLIEAMACKVPVIGSDSGAIPEVIGDAGLIFPEGDAAALAGCLRELIESPSLRAELAERGYARAMRHYTQECIAEQTADFYRWLMRQ
jgi:glycosyltransferase involved in cell wall biosynthesis